MEIKKSRYFFVDGIRGIAIVNMVIFHFLYDVFIVYGRDPGWYGLLAVRIWQQMICWTFIFISGFVWQWGLEGNLRRGLRFNLYGFFISFVTFTFVPSETIWFGILNFMGCAVLLMFPLGRAIRKIPPFFGFCVCSLLFLLCKRIPYGYVGIGDYVLKVPEVFYAVKILTPFGFPFPGFRSSDYFPLIPWMFLYLCGYFSHGIFEEHSAWQAATRRRIPVLSAIGRRTIRIYLFHQPVCMFLCGLVFR